MSTSSSRGINGGACVLMLSVAVVVRMTINPCIPTMPGRSAWGFSRLHPPVGHCLHQARSAVRCRASPGGGQGEDGCCVRRASATRKNLRYVIGYEGVIRFVCKLKQQQQQQQQSSVQEAFARHARSIGPTHSCCCALALSS